MTLSVVEHLEQARAKIEPRECWIRGVMATSSVVNNVPRLISPGSEFADCWCALGALLSIPDSPTKKSVEQLGRTIRDYWSPRHAINSAEVITEFNDSNPHEKVLEMFDRAITSAKEST